MEYINLSNKKQYKYVLLYIKLFIAIEGYTSLFILIITELTILCPQFYIGQSEVMITYSGKNFKILIYQSQCIIVCSGIQKILLISKNQVKSRLTMCQKVKAKMSEFGMINEHGVCQTGFYGICVIYVQKKPQQK